MRSSRCFPLAAAALLVVGAPSCRRPLGQPRDAGSDVGAPSVGDAARSDGPGGDLAVDVGSELPADAVSPDGAPDAPAAVCPADVPPLDVCGCGCCGGVPSFSACYYPSQGQSRDTIPNPIPPPPNCATAGCSLGQHYVCCADPGVQESPNAIYCGDNVSREDLPLFAFTKRDAEMCTTIQVGLSSGSLPLVSTPFGAGIAEAWRVPCGGSGGANSNAIGGMGSVTLRPMRPTDTTTHYDVHVVLFFDDGTGTADAVRIDADDVAAASCNSTGCAACAGACAFDTTYRYGFVGGLFASLDTVILTPPASYEHTRASTTSMQVQICEPAPPLCHSPTIDVADLMAAFGETEVQDAFTRSVGAGTTPFYGQDHRPVDGQAFQITRAGAGGGFLIGAPCPAGSTPSACMEIPGALSRLESLLVAFDRQQLADPSCAALRP